MNTKCNEIRNLIADSVTGLLPAEEARRIDEHLRECAACCAYAEALRREDLLLGQLVAGVRENMPSRREQLLQDLSRRQSKWINYPTGWRRIMRSRATRLTAAGVILAAAVIGISQFNGTAVKAVEFSEIAKALGEVPWMHASAVADMPNVTGRIELWIGFEAKVQGERMPDGKVSFHRLQEHERAEYDPNSNTITLNYAQESDFSPQMSSPAMIVESMQKMLQEHGAEIAIRMGEYQGRRLQVQDISLAKHFQGIDLYTVRLYVDPHSKLLCAMESKAVDANGVLISAAEATYEYPSTGPHDIYDLGVPRDAKIVNNMPPRDLRSVLERYRQIRADATREYIAVIAQNTAVNITDAINMVDVDYKSGRKHRQERHGVFDYDQTFRDPQDPAWDISRQRLGETFESMLAWSRRQIAEPGKTWIEVHLYDGQYDGSARKNAKNSWGIVRQHYAPDGSLGPQNALGDLAWPQILPGARIIQDEYAAEHNLICFERLQQGSVHQGTISPPGRFLHYLDPAWDYLCRRKVTEWRPDAPWQKDTDWLSGTDPNQMGDGSITVEDITEAFQAPNGHWYPKSIVERQTGIREDYRQAPLRIGTTKRVYLDLTPEFPEGIFDLDKLPGQ